jgi:hypothetical protein
LFSAIQITTKNFHYKYRFTVIEIWYLLISIEAHI